MKFNTLLFLIAFFAVVFAFKSNKDYHKLKTDKDSLQNQYDSLMGQLLIVKDEHALLEKVIENLKKDPTVADKSDLYINKIYK